jgi:hypothetical protein
VDLGNQVAQAVDRLRQTLHRQRRVDLVGDVGVLPDQVVDLGGGVVGREELLRRDSVFWSYAFAASMA